MSPRRIMMPVDYAITFACYNQVQYTRACVESLIASGIDLRRLVVVDNGSVDGTRAYLEALRPGHCVFNRHNLGCGTAWTQGALALQAEWTVVMNNDVVVAPGWLEGLTEAAHESSLQIVCPALIEGVLDYDLRAFAADAAGRMKGALRLGDRHAVCLAVHASVWTEVGYFRPCPKLLGFEDTLFFEDVRKSGIRTGMTGASWVHHHGSATVKAVKEELGIPSDGGLGDRNNKRLLNQSWLERKITKLRRTGQLRRWRRSELAAYGMTLHGWRESGRFRWV